MLQAWIVKLVLEHIKCYLFLAYKHPPKSFFTGFKHLKCINQTEGKEGDSWFDPCYASSSQISDGLDIDVVFKCKFDY